MPVTTCEDCGVEFSTPTPIEMAARSEPTCCPSCGRPVDLARVAEPRPKKLGSAGRFGAMVIVWLTVLADLAGTALLLADAMPGGGRLVPGVAAAIAAMIAHAALSLAALWPMRAGRIKRAVLLLRGALICWVAGGAAAFALGARPWPAAWSQSPSMMIVLAGVALVLLLVYLRTLEALAQAAEPPVRPDTAVPPRLALSIAGLALAVVNLVGGAALTWLAWRAWSDQQNPQPLLALAGFSAAAALGAYAVLAIGGVAYRRSRPMESAASLPRAVMAMFVAGLILLLAHRSGVLPPSISGPLAALAVIADVAAVALLHALLVPRGQAE